MGHRSRDRRLVVTLAVVTLAVVGLVTTACGGGATTPAADPTTSDSPSALSGSPPAVSRPPVITPLAQEPVVAPADGEKYTNPGAVIEHDGRWYMLRNSFTGFPGASRTDLLVSDDLLTWTEVEGANPLYTSEDVPYSSKNTFAMTGLVTDDGTWVAYLYTYSGSTLPGVIGRVTAPGPEGPWTVDPEPVLEPSGVEGRYDALRVSEPEVLRVGDEWLMWFTAWADQRTASIGLATSTDGITWTALDEPVLQGSQGWSRGSIGCPQVVRDGDGFAMVYDSSVQGVFANGLAFSDDGRTWTEHPANPVVAPEDVVTNGGFWQGALVERNGTVSYLLESGAASRTTAVYAYRFGLEAARSASVPEMTATATVDGSTVTIDVEAPGYDLRFVPGDTSATVAHAHAYIGGYPPDAGKEIPLGRDNVVHSRGDRITITGLAPGPYVIWVVLAGSDEAVLDWPEPVAVRVTVSG